MTHQNEERPHLHSRRAIRNVVSFLPGFIWILVILTLSLMPGGTAQKLFLIEIPYADKIGHALFYTILAVLLLHGSFRSGIGQRAGLIFTLVFATALGVTVEWLQEVLTTTRHFEVFDLMANIMGTLVGCALFIQFLKKKYHGS